MFTIIELIIHTQLPSNKNTNFLIPPPNNITIPYILIKNTNIMFKKHFMKIPPTKIQISEQNLKKNHLYKTKKNPNTDHIITLKNSFVFNSKIEIKKTFIKHFEQQQNNIKIINFKIPKYNNTHTIK